MPPFKPENIKILLDRIVSYSKSNIINFIPPEELEKQLEERLLNSPNSFEEVMKTVDLVLEKCVNTSHQHFVNQLYGGVNPIGMAAAYIVEKMNTNQ
jgi:hypothetical protein